jgi:hypothetical protein
MRERLILGSVLVGIFALGVTASPGLASTPEPLGFSSYGSAEIGDAPAEVRRQVPGVEACYELGGRCACASVAVGERTVTFVYGLDGRSGLDLITTSSQAVPGPRGISVGDGVGKLKRLFPNVHRRHPIYTGYQRFVVSRGRIGLLATTRSGRIAQLTTGKSRYFDYEEYCG